MARGLSVGLAVALAASACADLAMEPDRVPSSIALEPKDTLIREGDEARLRVTVLDQDGDPFPGLPSWAPPRWTLSDPEAVAVQPNGDVRGLAGGDVRVQADVAGLTAWTQLRVNPLTVALSAPAVYLVQSVQNVFGDVPLIAGRDALLRVFVTGDRISFYQSQARASFYLGDEEIHTVTLASRSERIPMLIQEGRLDRSFNAAIPGEVLQPGVELVVELNVDEGVPLAPASEVRVPAQGRMPLDVRAVPELGLTVVPVLQEANPNTQIFAWTSSLDPDGSTMRFTRTVLPVGELDVEIHEPYTTTADLTTAAGWNAFIREIRVLRLEEGSSRYYYGTTVLPPRSEYGGLGYIGLPVSVGQPKSETLAHELGHNMTLRHAPCGSVSSFDPSYPYDGGSTGVWGYDRRGGSGLGAVVDPDTYKDLMGYCTPRWVSDYHFKKALAYRLEAEEPPAPAPEQPVLLLWGGVHAGQLVLEPAFVVEARPVLPTAEGPYRLEGRDAEGRSLFSLSFALEEVAWGGGHFTFALPLDEDWSALARVTLEGAEGTVTLDRDTPGGPMAMVTEPTTGRIRAILRDGEVPAALAVGSSVRFSAGLPDRRELVERR